MRRWLTIALTAVAAAAVTVAVLALWDPFGDGGSAEDRGAPPALAQDGELGDRINGVYERARGAVAFIRAEVAAGPRESPFGPAPEGGVATGSGWLYDDEGHIVTNAHVVENARRVSVQVEENELIEAEVVGTDLSTDLAVIEADAAATGAEPLPLRPAADDLRVGDPVVAMGSPLGLEGTVTVGILSALDREIQAPNGFTIENAIQSDAAINPGNSGGPLLDFEGRVIGVNSQIATTGGGGFIGIGFAVSAETVRDIVPQLIEDGTVDRPFLGVSATTVTPSIARVLGLEVESGALVASVAPGSPAARAGIRGGQDGAAGGLPGGGDVIVGLGDRRVESSQQLVEAVAAHEVGDRVDVETVRGGERVTRTVRLAERP